MLFLYIYLRAPTKFCLPLCNYRDLWRVSELVQAFHPRIFRSLLRAAYPRSWVYNAFTLTNSPHLPPIAIVVISFIFWRCHENVMCWVFEYCIILCLLMMHYTLYGGIDIRAVWSILLCYLFIFFFLEVNDLLYCPRGVYLMLTACFH